MQKPQTSSPVKNPTPKEKNRPGAEFIDTTGNQASSGDLNNTDSAPPRTYDKSIEPLELAALQPFLTVPDYKTQTISLYPIIIRSLSSAYCIDGWEKIEEARKRGDQQITCEIIHLQQDCQIDIALWKMAVRVAPVGGRCLYPELVRNCSILIKMIIESQANPVIFSHGGPRRGLSYTDNREDNVRVLLADRLCKSPKTINKYLNHAEYINDSVFAELIGQEANKSFFESIQPNKRALVRSLTEDGKSAAEIESEVSTNVLRWLQEFMDTGKVAFQPAINSQTDAPPEPETPEETTPPETAVSSIQMDSPQQSEFRHQAPRTEEPENANLSIDTVKAELSTEAGNLLEASTFQDSDLNQLEYTVQNLLNRVAFTLQKIRHLKCQMKMEGL